MFPPVVEPKMKFKKTAGIEFEQYLTPPPPYVFIWISRVNQFYRDCLGQPRNGDKMVILVVETKMK